MRAYRAITLILAPLAVICCIALYLHIARIQNVENHRLGASDQSAFMDFAVEAYASRWQYTGRRNQMPLYPWIMAIFWSPDMSEEAFFAVGKQVNIWLSVLILALLGAAFLRRFSRLYAIYAILCLAFLAYVLKSPFFQAELLYYGVFAAAYIRALDSLRRPGWRLSLEVGVWLGLAHFAKASALPALLIYLGCVGLRFFIQALRGKQARESALRLLLHALLSALAFLILLSPYLHESYQRYGYYFYNVNTTFYVWYDSWGEAKAGTLAAGDAYGYPDMPPEDIPGLQKYLRDHSTQQVIDRFVTGGRRLFEFGCTLENSVHRYGYCSQVAFGLALLAFCLPWLLLRTSRRALLANAHIVIFALAIFLAYALGAAWYMPISGNQGPRVLLVLIAPFFWTLGMVTHAPELQAIRLRIGHLHIKLMIAVYALLSISLVYEIAQVIIFRAAEMYGGK